MGRSTVAVIIPTFNHACFLADAIESALAQTRPADEIIVVDDGSTDDPAAVVARFRDVRLVRQENRGLSGARNTGLRICKTSHVIFLDSDDRLLPNAIEAGLACFADRPDCAFVYGGYRLISENNDPVAPDVFPVIHEDMNVALLRKNQIGMVAAVLFRRDRLLAIDGFDEALRRCEDYDVYLRITQTHSTATHPTIIAEYRRRRQNMSSNYVEQLKTGLGVLDRHEARIASNPIVRKALREGRANRRAFYASQMLDATSSRWRSQKHVGILVRDLIQAARWSPYFTLHMLLGVLGRRASKVLPRAIVRCIEWVSGKPYPIPVGSLRFGDFRRLSPISRHHFSRGMPVDRYYIEKFLAKNASDIHGRTLEIAGDSYTVQFGGARVTRSEVLHAVSGNPSATLVGDLATGKGIPLSAFDCMILTQTLTHIYSVQEAIANIRNALRPGGVALITVPGITQINRYDMDRWGDYWRFTDASARRLFGDVFGPENVTVVTYGNVLAACAFLHCVAVEELQADELDYHDVDYQVVVAIRVMRPMEPVEI